MSKEKTGNHHKPVSKGDVARIQGAVAKKNDGKVSKGSYVGRMQDAAERNTKNSQYK